jgi:hypothetical protein
MRSGSGQRNERATMMHKFLATGARGPLSGFAWPAPGPDALGAWVEVEGPLAPCARGIHVCRPFELAHWIHDELWELEVDGEQTPGLDCIVVPRARLVRRIPAWGEQAQRFAEACVEHAAAQVEPAHFGVVSELLDDARSLATSGYVAVSAFTAALAVSRLPSASGSAYRAERAWQSAWIERELLAAV